MMQMAANVQQQVAEAQDRLVQRGSWAPPVAGWSPSPSTATSTWSGLHIDPAAVDPDDPSMLEDLVRAAWQDAYDQVAQLQAPPTRSAGWVPAAGSAACSVVAEWPTAYAAAVQELIDCLGRLPGIGPKSAQRVAFHLLKVDNEEANRLARAIVEVKEKVGFCTRCFNIAEGELCQICSDTRRDDHVLCVVEEPRDVVAIERTREFRGRYHVLQGAIDHLQGVGPDQLKIRELIQRVGAEGITEVILCTNPNLEGEATALYLEPGPRRARPGRVTHRERSPRGRRPRVRRRAHAGPCARGPPGRRERLNPSIRSGAIRAAVAEHHYGAADGRSPASLLRLPVGAHRRVQPGAARR